MNDLTEGEEYLLIWKCPNVAACNILLCNILCHHINVIHEIELNVTEG
jgi:hypothetical protein